MWAFDILYGLHQISIFICTKKTIYLHLIHILFQNTESKKWQGYKRDLLLNAEDTFYSFIENWFLII